MTPVRKILMNKEKLTNTRVLINKTPTCYQMVSKLQNLWIINRKTSKNSYLLIKGIKWFEVRRIVKNCYLQNQIEKQIKFLIKHLVNFISWKINWWWNGFIGSSSKYPTTNEDSKFPESSSAKQVFWMKLQTYHLSKIKTHSSLTNSSFSHRYQYVNSKFAQKPTNEKCFIKFVP